MSESANSATAAVLTEKVTEPLKRAFVGKDEIIDLLAVSLVAGENLFLLGPPGTAKSALVQELARRLDGQIFDYLLTRFTEPNELFGPFDIRQLRDGQLVTNTEGMLPEASFVFLDELLNANSAILNSLLMVLNERIFRRGRETIKLPLLMVVGASNRLPEDDALNALFDRFLLRVPCDNVAPEALAAVLTAGWRLDNTSDRPTGVVSVKEIRQLQRRIADVQLESVREPYVELVQRLRHAGIPISDRRAVRLQRVIAASALLCGRQEANRADFWVLRYIWNTEEQQPVLASLIQNALEKASENEMAVSHTRARQADEADPEQIGRGLSNIERQLNDGVEDTERVYLQDQVAILASRCEWVRNEQQREFLQQQVQQLWDKLGVNAK